MLIPLIAAAPVVQDAGAILLDQRRTERQRVKPKISPEPPPRKGKASVRMKGSGTPIRGIRFKGVRAPARVAEAARRFIGRKADRHTLTELAGSLSRAYEKTDVALYSVAITDQDLSTGVVTVRLTEGRIAKVAVRSDRPDSYPLMRARLARLLDEKPLSRATFERQFSLIRSTPGLDIDTRFKDPGGNGALDLIVTPKQKRTKFSLGFSNRGVRQLGDGQIDGRAEFYGLIRDGDQLQLSGSVAPDFKRYATVSAGYAVPLSPSGLSLAGNIGYLETRPRGTSVRGSAKVAGLTLSYPLIRDFKQSLEVSLGLDGVDSSNALFGDVIASERTRALRLAVGYAHSGKKRSVSAVVSVARGLDILNAHVDAPLADATFNKLSGSLDLAQAIGKRMALRISASGQYSADALPAVERFAVGGAELGRAFDTGYLTGDRGGGVSGELAFRLVRAKAFKASEIYVFADKAWIGIQNRIAPGMTDLSLSSVGGGIRARWNDKIELGLEASRPVDLPLPDYERKWRVAVSWSLSL